MRIGVDAREWVRGRQTGIGRYLETILQRALETRPEWNWTLYLHGDRERRLQSEAIEYVDLPHGPAPLVDQVFLAGRLKKDPPRLFFSPYPKGPWRAPCPVIVVVHDMHPLVLPPEWGGLKGMKRSWFLWYLRRSAAKSARVVTVSQVSARDIGKYLDVPAEKLAVIHESVAPGLVDSGRNEEVLRQQGLTGPFLLAVGHLRRHKNQETLIRAWASLQDPPRGARLVVVGSGEDRDRLHQIVAETGVTARTAWLERADDTVLSVLYREATAVLQPSIIEGFGLPVLEAMASGTPVVVSSGGSLPEVVADAAPVIEPEDIDGWATEMERMLGDEAYRNAWRAKAVERAKAFVPEETTDRLLDLIAEVGAESAADAHRSPR